MKCFCLATFRKAQASSQVWWLMIENSSGLQPRPSFNESFAPADPPVLTLEMPDLEEIAKAIWERQDNNFCPEPRLAEVAT
jgi:hypothetical protein